MKIICITPIKHLDSVFNKLNNLGDLSYHPNINKEELSKINLSLYDVIFCNPNKQSFILNEEVLENFNGRVVTASTGVNHIDISYCKKNNIDIISLTNERDLLNDLPSTAELAFGLMLSMLRKIPQGKDHVSKYNWDYTKFIGRQVKDLKIGIVGFGRLGKIMYNYCEAFGADVYAYDPYVAAPKSMSLEHMVSECDVISLHVHVTDQTKGMINKKLLQYTTKEIYIINTSRGEIVNENDIIELLKSKKITGYGADVVTDEFGNIKNSPVIIAMNSGYNIIVTPHVGGMTQEGQEKAYNHIIDNI